MGIVEFTGEELELRMFRSAAPSVVDQRTFEQLAADVAKRYGISANGMLGVSRHPLCVKARRELYAALRERGWSYPQIGHACRRDHTTIMAALKGYF